MQQTLGDSTVQDFGRSATWDDSGYAPGVYTCKLCWKVFKCQQNLDDHVNGKHLDSKRFRCRLCGKAFKWRSLLSGHRKKCALTVSSVPGLSQTSSAQGLSQMSSVAGPSHNVACPRTFANVVCPRTFTNVVGPRTFTDVVTNNQSPL